MTKHGFCSKQNLEKRVQCSTVQLSLTGYWYVQKIF